MAHQDKEQPLVAHLMELRDRLLKAIVGILAVFLVLSPFANKIYTVLASPLLAHLPETSSMIAIDVASPFLTPFKMTLVLALFITVPWTLYQIWAFVAPGLYRHEQRLVYPLLVSSTILFYLGMAFAYFVVFPLMFGFLIGFAPVGVEVMTDIARYLDFVLTIFFAFGVAFEVPVATVLLVMTGVTTPEALASKRPYVFVLAFVAGMLLTPPDIISQTLLAIPIWLLFEVGVMCSKLMLKRQKQAREASESDYVSPTDEEMEAEMDNIEAEEDRGTSGTKPTG